MLHILILAELFDGILSNLGKKPTKYIDVTSGLLLSLSSNNNRLKNDKSTAIDDQVQTQAVSIRVNGQVCDQNYSTGMCSVFL